MTYENKTKPTVVTPKQFLDAHLADDQGKRRDAETLIDLYSSVTGSPCVMWGKIFGFGTFHYLDSKGGEHASLATGFAISTTGFTLYNMMGWETYRKDIEALGKCKLSGKSCLAIKRLEGLDLKVLKAVVKKSFADMKKKYNVEK